MATVSSTDFPRIAARHNVDLNQVKPLHLDERLAVLKATLQRVDVPYPIDAVRGEQYYAQAAAGNPFAVGTLSATRVDLGQYFNQQFYDQYSMEDHLSWACLIAEQQRTKHRYACREYLEGERIFAIGGTVVPDFYLLNARIYQQTGWQLATVNTIIPAELFFTCHSNRFFPVTTFMRPLEQDYLEEPDIGHDVAGHVSTFTIPVVAKLMQAHGLARDLIYAERDQRMQGVNNPEELAKIQAKADELLFYAQRIYWFTVEFGLVMESSSVRAFGAGILSSPGETAYSIDSVKPNRILIDPSNDQDLIRIVTTDYLISEFQKTYFVMKSFDTLASLTPERIVWAARQADRLPHFTWREIAPGDTILNVGTEVTGPNEKYYRWLAKAPMDESLSRSAQRNLKMAAEGRLEGIDWKQVYRIEPPSIPKSVLEAYLSTSTHEK